MSASSSFFVVSPLWQGLIAFALCATLTISVGARLIPYLRRHSLGQHAYEDAPQTHAVKSGTPTMGGLLFMLVLAVTVLLAALIPTPLRTFVIALAGLGLACGAIGLLDDLFSIRRGRNRGLRARTKFFLTAVVAFAYLWVTFVDFGWPATFSQASVPFAIVSGHAVAIPVWSWFAIGVLTIVATTHAVNLTDGLDGLASGTMLPPLAIFVWFGLQAGPLGSVAAIAGKSAALVDFALAGSLVGFLYYNRHPARLIMGDTGSLALGGILAGSAILLNLQLLLIVIGFVFVAETLSVILQVASFKLTGKRIFRMSPLHHHFELAGWPETKVTHRFWAASALCSLLGLVLYSWR